jgi:translation initiation factor 1 (eIF-1/SUI1)
VSLTIPKIPNEARPEEDRNLAGATVNAPGAELANSSHSHECVVGSRLQALDGRRAFGGIGFSDVVLGGAPGGDDGHVDVLAKRKILISAQKMKRKKGEGEVTKVEGIPETHNLGELLKKLKAKDMLSCGGHWHVAQDKATGSRLLVLQGSFSAQLARFLTREGMASADCIEHRG